MSGFAPGDEVVCVDDAAHSERRVPGILYYDWERPVVSGQHYIVRWAGLDLGKPCLKLVGVVRRDNDDPLHISRFRPVKREAIEIFRQMARSKKPLVEV